MSPPRSSPQKASTRRRGGPPRPPPDSARALALKALRELEEPGGRANVIVPALLAGSGLEERDRAF
jgi:hypothetical protein